MLSQTQRQQQQQQQQKRFVVKYVMMWGLMSSNVGNTCHQASVYTRSRHRLFNPPATPSTPPSVCPFMTRFLFSATDKQ